MVRLLQSLNAWGTSGFADVLKKELEQLGANALPLQQGLSTSSYALDTPVTVMIRAISEEAGLIRVRAGIFYSGIIAGCSCADDPTPVSEQNEYCDVRVDIDRQTGEATIALLAE